MSIERVKRKTREPVMESLFDVGPKWQDEYWDMPEFTMGDASPQRKLSVNFATQQDFVDFCNALGVKLSPNADSMWYPPQDRLKPKEYIWVGSPSRTRYPIYIPSKGRFDCETTGGLLTQAGADFRFVVEPQEAEIYEKRWPGRVLALPFSNLGQGSIPARNWIWEHAKAHGSPYHWIIDDNVFVFYRTNANRRLIVEKSSAPLRIVEDFVDRYDNIAFAGLAYLGFCPDRNEIAPYTMNTRVYSVTLINTAMEYRWRGRYNEDTDICLRALKDGWATVLFRSFLMDKSRTSKGDGSSGMKGGNSDVLYNGARDYRLAFAESLASQHPDVARVVWKFGRWHHEVDYSRFKKNKIRLRENVTRVSRVNEYGLHLVRGDDE